MICHHHCDHHPRHNSDCPCDHPHHDYVDQYRVSGGSGGSGGEGTNGGGLSYRVSIIINMNIRMIMRMIIGLIMNMRRITRMIMRIGVTIWIIKLVKIVVLVNDNDNRDRLCPRSQNRATGEVLP